MWFLTSWLTSPWMLGAGALAVASPIIIHLLNKRRFKIVQWAAMDFLLEANKKNKRRVQLENLIVLLLRCLAMLLLGLLLARPFLPTSLSELLQNTKRFERIVVLDDSVSMLASEEGGSAWQTAIEGLKSLTRQMSESRTDDTLTVLLTSRPETPFLVAEAVSGESIESVMLELENLKPADLPADYRGTLSYLDQYVRTATPGLNRVVYVMSDQRLQDWSDGSAGEDPEAPAGRVREISQLTAGTFLVDLSVSNENNLAVVDVRQERQLVAGSVSRLEVDIKNWGNQPARDVEVEFRVGQGQPQLETIPEVGAGETKTVAFQHIFNKSGGLNRITYTSMAGREGARQGPAAEQDQFPSEGTGADAGDQLFDDAPFTQQEQQWDSPIEISLSVKSALLDGLKADSQYFYVGRVLNRIPVLLVDGDPSTLAARSETYALLPLASADTGIAVDVITGTELETAPLSKYRVIFLCNVDQVSYDRVASLEQWVRAGGNLVLLPGNRVQSVSFNDSFYREGKGLSPVSLVSIAGDPTRQTSVTLEPDPQPHPFLQKLIEADRGIFSRTNIFSWWVTQLPATLDNTRTVVPLRLSDQDRSPALIDHRLGQGRVVLMSMAADGDWSDWPSSPSYIVVMFDMIREMVDDSLEIPVVQVGDDLLESIDLGRYKNQVKLLGPNQQQWETIAQPAGTFKVKSRSKKTSSRLDANAEAKNADTKNADTNDKSDRSQAGSNQAESNQEADPANPGADNPSATSVFYEAMFERLPQQGFYQLQLQATASPATDGNSQAVRTIACNLQAAEGDLRLVDRTKLTAWVGDKVELVPIDLVSEKSVDVARDEFWFQVLLALAIVLGAEQILACWFGTRRK